VWKNPLFVDGGTAYTDYTVLPRANLLLRDHRGRLQGATERLLQPDGSGNSSKRNRSAV